MVLTCQINQQRLWNTLLELGEIGSSPSSKEEGVTRLSLSVEDLKARQYVINLMKEAGLKVRIDAVGNIIGKLEGTVKQAPIVLTGSHIDTVFQGGIFDGALGVLGAIEAARSIKESGFQLKHSIEVVSFTDEEGIRFGTGYIGSKAMAGELDEAIFSLTDANGMTYAEAFRQAQLDPRLYKQAKREREELKAYIELHIEQGKVLEEHHLPVGIVTDIQGPIWLDVVVKGHADHAGATPMYMRKDAALAMAELMLDIEKIAKTYDGVGTVGKVNIEPGGVNIIPGLAAFSVDLRHINKESRTKMINEVYEAINRICQKRDVHAEIEVKKAVDPTSCQVEVIEVIEESCKELDVPTMRLQCGAGHDSLIMAKLTKMGMIFVRSKEGISHNPKEWSDYEDCMIGTQVLLNTLVRLAE